MSRLIYTLFANSAIVVFGALGVKQTKEILLLSQRQTNALNCLPYSEVDMRFCIFNMSKTGFLMILVKFKVKK